MAALQQALTGGVAPPPAQRGQSDAPTKMVVLFDDPVMSRRVVLRLVRLMADYGTSRYSDALDRLLAEEAARRGWEESP